MAYEQDFYHFFSSLFFENVRLICDISAFSERFKQLLFCPLHNSTRIYTTVHKFGVNLMYWEKCLWFTA